MLNPPPVNTAVDRNGGQLESSWWQWFVSLFNFVKNGVVDYTSTSVQVPTNGFSITIADKVQVLTLNPAGNLATGTITFAVTPYDGQYMQVSSTKNVAALTLSPSGSDTVRNAPTALVAGIGFTYYYRASDTTWYRLS